MNILAAASMIIYASVHTGQTCDKVFVDSVMEIRKHRVSKAEKPKLERFAKAACETSNPDIFWQIAKQESSFRFDIVRVNKQAKVLQKNEATKYVSDLKKSQIAYNADIGVMQINWYWHRKGFKNDPIKMLDPAEQVKYIESRMAPNMAKRCSADNWVGCYHNPSDKKRAHSYQKKVKKSARLLTMTLLYYIKDKLAKMPKHKRKKLPLVKKKEFYLAYRNLVKMQVPNDNLEEYIAKEKIKKIDRNLLITSDLKWDLFNT